MPLTTANLVNVFGLNTEGSIFDPQQVPPNSLYDCKNIAFYKYGQASARKGIYTWVLDPTVYAYPYTSIQFVSMGTYDNFLVTYKNTNVMQAFITDGTTQTNNRIVQHTAYPRTLTTASGFFIISAQADKIWKWVESGNNFIAMAPNGLCRTGTELVGATSTKNSIIYKTPFPVIYNFSINTDTTLTDNVWFKSGYVVKVKAVVETYYPETGGFYNSPVLQAKVASLSTFDLINVSKSCGVKFTLNVTSANIKDLDWAVLKVYRTKQYLVGGQSETEYHLCYEAALDKGTNNGSTTTFTDIVLTANDDFISSSETIYTDQLNDGRLGEAAPPPACSSITQYKQHTVYANVYRAPYVKLQMITPPSPTGITEVFGITTRIGFAYSTNIPKVVNSANAPAASGVMSYTDYTFRGIPAASGYFPTIRGVDPLLPADVNLIGVTPFYAKTAASGISVAGLGGTSIVKIKPDASVFDLSKFSSPGIMAIVDLNGNVKDIVQYRDMEQVQQEGLVNFFDATFLSGAALSGITSPSYIYYLPGVSVNNLPIYPLPSGYSTTTPSSPTGVAQSASGFSLLPTYYTYPTDLYINKEVGTVGAISYDAGSGKIMMNPAFSGLFWMSVDKVLKNTVQQLAWSILDGRNNYNPIAYYLGGSDPFSMIISATQVGTDIDGTQRSNNTTNTFDALYLRTTSASGTPSCSFSENIPTSGFAGSFSEEVHIKNGLIFSKPNRPEEVPLQYHLNPLKVGSDNNEITNVVVNNDQLYVFKLGEGVFRVELIEGPNIAEVSTLAVVDNTVWCAAQFSMQEFNESVYFLSNKGIMQLNNNQFTPVGKAIETEIKTAFLAETNPDKIRSWSNELRRIYGIHFPTSNLTYVLDILTGQWSKWGLPFESAYVNNTGVQYFTQKTTVNEGSGAATIYHIRKDTAGDITSTADQYDESRILTAATIVYSHPTLTITRAGTGSTRLSNLATMYSLATDTINSANANYCYLYQPASGAYTRLLYVSSNAATGQIVFTVESSAALTTPAVTDSLVIGVNAHITFNRFFITGSMDMSQFSEAHLHIIGRATNVTIGFECDTETPTFSVEPVKISTTQEQIRTLIPRNQSRGRWIQTKVAHNRPLERFTLAGIGYVYKDMNTFRTKQKNV